jgi:predicted transcriptional regulator
MSQDACLRFIGYYNLNKVKYYISSLQSKGMIAIAEVIHSHNRYKLTPLGISVIDDINGSFDRCLYDWFAKYNICL